MVYFLYIPFSFFKFSWKLNEISTEFLQKSFLVLLSNPFFKISKNFSNLSKYLSNFSYIYISLKYLLGLLKIFLLQNF